MTPVEASDLTVKLLLSVAAWYRNSGDHALARELLAIAATRSDSQQLAQEQAALALQTGEPERALEIWTELAERKETLSAWTALGRCHLELGNLDEAAAIAAAQVALNPDSVTARQLAGDVDRAMGHGDSARAQYEAILAMAPGNVNALLALGWLAALAGDRAEALAVIDRVHSSESPLTANQLLGLATLAELLDQATKRPRFAIKHSSARPSRRPPRRRG